MKRNFFLLLVIAYTCLNTQLAYPNQSTNQPINNFTNERLARWYINYASYLIDIGKYLEALENYETAYEMSTLSSIKTQALLGKAVLLSTFLDAPEEAIRTYQKIEKEFPEKKELAIYREGLLFFDIGKEKEAKRIFIRYQKLYPNGRFKFQVEALMKNLPKMRQLKTEKPKRPILRVRLLKGIKNLNIIGQNICIEKECKDNYRVELKKGIIYINEKPISKKKICFYSKNPIEIRGKKTKRVRGKICIKIYQGKLLVLNLIDIEQYLLSVVPSESPASWNIEALKAQAVASRTYAYYQALHRRNKAYDLVDNEGDQAYRGIDREHPRSSKAVKSTEGEVLVWDNKPILAMFTANSGGYTADPKAVFDLEKPYLKAKPDPESLKGKMARWRKVYSITEVKNRLKKIGISIYSLKDIKTYEIGPSGRIVKIKLITEKGTKILRTRTTIRRILKLPDILLTIKKDGNYFILEGRGFGHGVGYSQWGGYFMGQKYGYKRILNFYYPGAKIKKLW